MWAVQNFCCGLYLQQYSKWKNTCPCQSHSVAATVVRCSNWLHILLADVATAVAVVFLVAGNGLRFFGGLSKGHYGEKRWQLRGLPRLPRSIHYQHSLWLCMGVLATPLLWPTHYGIIALFSTFSVSSYGTVLLFVHFYMYVDADSKLLCISR